MHAPARPFPHVVPPVPLQKGPPDRFHRFAPRTLAYSDPRSASLLPPFARARRFLEHVDTLAPPAWDALLERVGGVTDAAEEARRHLSSMFVTPDRRAARDAVALEARRVCLHAVDTRRLACSRGADATHSVTSAAFALVLRDLLPPELFDRVYEPFTLVRDGGLPPCIADVRLPRTGDTGGQVSSLDPE